MLCAAWNRGRSIFRGIFRGHLALLIKEETARSTVNRLKVLRRHCRLLLALQLVHHGGCLNRRLCLAVHLYLRGVPDTHEVIDVGSALGLILPVVVHH